MLRSVASKSSSSSSTYKKLTTTRFITNQRVFKVQFNHQINQTLLPFLSSFLISKPLFSQNPSLFFFLSHYSTANAFTTESATYDGFNDSTSDGLVDSLELANGVDGEVEGLDGKLVSGALDETVSLDEGDGVVVVAEVNDDGEVLNEVNVEKLESLLSLLKNSVDGSIESSFDGLELSLDEDFVVKVLETPLIPGGNLVVFFKWAMKKQRLCVSSRALEALVRAISGGELRRSNAYALWDLVKEIGEKEIGVLKVEMLNELIALFSSLGKGKAALEVFNKFEEFGCVPNDNTYYFTIEALCRRKFYDWAGSVCEKMLSAECVPNAEKIGRIISMLCKGSKILDAHTVYLLGKQKNERPSQSSVNFLIKSLAYKNETVKLALEMLDDFSEESRWCAIMPFSNVMRGLCRTKDIEGAKALLFKMIEEGPPPGNANFNSVIDALSKNGDLEEAKKMLTVMESRGLKSDLYAYTVIMSGYVKDGQMDAACEILAEAKKKHSKLSPVTYHVLISGYCKLEEFDKALSLLAEMKDYGVQPNADEYNKLIQSLCLKALDWETAETLFEEMKEEGLYLSGMTQGLINAVKGMEADELKRSEEEIAS